MSRWRIDDLPFCVVRKPRTDTAKLFSPVADGVENMLQIPRCRGCDLKVSSPAQSFDKNAVFANTTHLSVKICYLELIEWVKTGVKVVL